MKPHKTLHLERMTCPACDTKMVFDMDDPAWTESRSEVFVSLICPHCEYWATLQLLLPEESK